MIKPDFTSSRRVSRCNPRAAQIPASAGNIIRAKSKRAKSSSGKNAHRKRRIQKAMTRYSAVEGSDEGLSAYWKFARCIYIRVRVYINRCRALHLWLHRTFKGAAVSLHGNRELSALHVCTQKMHAWRYSRCRQSARVIAVVALAFAASICRSPLIWQHLHILHIRLWAIYSTSARERERERERARANSPLLAFGHQCIWLTLLVAARWHQITFPFAYIRARVRDSLACRSIRGPFPLCTLRESYPPMRASLPLSLCIVGSFYTLFFDDALLLEIRRYWFLFLYVVFQYFFFWARWITESKYQKQKKYCA